MVACHRGMLLGPQGPGRFWWLFCIFPLPQGAKSNSLGQKHAWALALTEELRPSFIQSLVCCRLARVQRPRFSPLFQVLYLIAFHLSPFPLKFCHKTLTSCPRVRIFSTIGRLLFSLDGSSLWACSGLVIFYGLISSGNKLLL